MLLTKRLFALAAIIALLVTLPPEGSLAKSSEQHFQVVPFEFDPGHSGIVTAAWVRHLGLPDDTGNQSFGLLLSKNGNSSTFASAGASLRGVRRMTLTELGYDVRNGGHCGAGAPRFNVVTNDGVLHFIGCNSPSPTVSAAPATADGATTGWKRLRWTPAQAFPPISANAKVRSIVIIFDEGVDATGGPDQSGFAVIDNIAVNGVIVDKPGGGGGR